MITLNLEDEFIVEKMKNVYFLDIETSLINARIFRPGIQTVTAEQTNSYTKLLTASWGSMYDLYTKKEKGVIGVGNHFDAKTFAKDPLDDTLVLRGLWEVLDKADVIVAHNVSFDAGWAFGRFLQLGWPLPSKFSTVCTYTALHKYTFTSKKLDQLSKQLIGTSKLKTNFDLWNRCSDGDLEAFEEMLQYNKGDVYDTMFQVYLRTCQYFPDYAVDMCDYGMEMPLCKVTGEPLEPLDQAWMNRANGCEYQLYRNDTLGITYRDRYNLNSSKSGLGLIRHHV